MKSVLILRHLCHASRGDCAWIGEAVLVLVSEVFDRFLSNRDEFGKECLIVEISIQIGLSHIKLAELFCSIIVLCNIWKLESFFLKNLSGVNLQFVDWVDSFFVNISPLTQSVLVV